MLQIPELSDNRVRLSLLCEADREGLLHAAKDPDVWKWFLIDLNDPIMLDSWIKSMLDDYAKGNRVPFTIRDNSNQQIIGSTSYMNIASTDRCLEIGTTWMDKTYHGTGLNFSMKYLLLKYAFETLGYFRVEFRTDVLNLRSRKAIEKLGASQEGVFRSHRFNKTKGRRDSVVYSIIKDEWPQIKELLEDKISRVK